MYKCRQCGAVGSEFKKVIEPHGEKIFLCEYCQSDDPPEPIGACISCGGECETELCFCFECLSDIDLLNKFGQEDGINYFLDNIFTDPEINEILLDELKNILLNNTELAEQKLSKIKGFVSDNKYDIADFLKRT